MNARFFMAIILSYLMSIFFVSNLSYGKSGNNYVLNKIKDFVYANGTPHSLNSVYGIETPDDGFSAFYIYLWKNNLVYISVKDSVRVYPFIYKDEEERKHSGNDYSRCNVSIKYDGKIAIPIRKFQSGSAEDSAPCLGYNTGYRIIKHPGKNINWFIFKVVYEDANLNSHEIYEVYFISKKENKFCYSERVTGLINNNKRFDINKETPRELDFDECGNFVR
ncbi:hypothetical protein [Photorhabdus asymbiotica]|uniref:hypothetical protein n=1 Tax=Photorhabdus asymbiotica TaxID=291112 RepID=UPI003DA70110